MSRDIFNRGFEKFAAFVDAYDLIPADRSRIVVAYSGGKDASVLCDFLNEYKNTVRKDIAIELITVIFPRFIYDSPDPSRKKEVDDAIEYWTRRGFIHTRVHAGTEFPDSILQGDNPCKQCAMVIKPTLLSRQILKHQYKDAVYCVGLTLDDSIGWFLELALISAGQGDMSAIKHASPSLFAAMMFLSTRVTCRLEVEKNNLLWSRPLMAFSDGEVRTLSTQRKLPLIPEDCKEVQQRDAFVDSPRRELTIALTALRNKYQLDPHIGKDAVYASYDRAAAYFESSGLLPDLKEREQYLSEHLASLACRESAPSPR
ncbi:MAG: hypothetical protein QNJ97_02340 [Myxococcota bacterium]|nr:hypothetical protein [Myxococcota bacterium]